LGRFIGCILLARGGVSEGIMTPKRREAFFNERAIPRVYSQNVLESGFEREFGGTWGTCNTNLQFSLGKGDS